MDVITHLRRHDLNRAAIIVNSALSDSSKIATLLPSVGNTVCFFRPEGDDKMYRLEIQDWPQEGEYK